MLPLPDFAPSSEKDVGFWPEATLRQMIHSAAGDDPFAAARKRLDIGTWIWLVVTPK